MKICPTDKYMAVFAAELFDLFHCICGIYRLNSNNSKADFNDNHVVD